MFFDTSIDANEYFNFGFTYDGLQVMQANAAGYDVRLGGPFRVRDPSAWYHVVIAVDTTQAIEKDRVKAYVNSERHFEDDNTLDYPVLNEDLIINSTNTAFIGKAVTNNSWNCIRFDLFENVLANFIFLPCELLSLPSKLFFLSSLLLLFLPLSPLFDTSSTSAKSFISS